MKNSFYTLIYLVTKTLIWLDHLIVATLPQIHIVQHRLEYDTNLIQPMWLHIKHNKLKNSVIFKKY